MLGNRLTRVRHTLVRFVLGARAVGCNCARACIPCVIGSRDLGNANRLPGFRSSLFGLAGRAGGSSVSFCLVPATRMPVAGLMHNRHLSVGRLPLGFATRAPYFHDRTNSRNHSAHNLVHRRRFRGIRVIGVTASSRSSSLLRTVAKRTRCVLRRLGLPCHAILLYANSVNFTTRGACSVRI